MVFVFRNNTIERFMPADYVFSGYDDISFVPAEAQEFVWFYQMPVKFDVKQITSEISTYISRLRLVLPAIGSRQLIAFTIVDYLSSQIELSDFSIEQTINAYNEELSALSKQYSNIKVIDFSRFTRRFSSAELIDWKMFFLSQMPINPKLAVPFKQWYASEREAVALQRCKCLVLDLDNTLWHGVLGEDGVGNIQMSGSYPGKAYHLWQEGLLELKKAGVILCINSKNNLSDVEEVWLKRDDMLLKKSDFAAVRINWQDKATNMIELSKELNIGLDSMVFVDDNPTERELLQQALPMVKVPLFPEQPYNLPVLYKTLVDDYFRIYALTDEDKNKTEQYRLNSERQEYAKLFVDMTDYLRSLAIVLTIEPINEQTLQRAAQLTQKTNQFNLTTRRYTESDIRQMLTSGARAWTLSVADKFGSYGLTGLIIINQECAIDTMLMSCRVLGKGIEDAFLKTILAQLKQEGVKQVVGEYIRTNKNSQVESFYEKNGFTMTDKNEDKSLYMISLPSAELTINDYFDIRVINH